MKDNEGAKNEDMAKKRRGGQKRDVLSIFSSQGSLSRLGRSLNRKKTVHFPIFASFFYPWYSFCDEPKFDLIMKSNYEKAKIMINLKNFFKEFFPAGSYFSPDIGLFLPGAVFYHSLILDYFF